MSACSIVHARSEVLILEGHPFLDPRPIIREEGLLWCTACGDPVTPQATMASQWLEGSSIHVMWTGTPRS